jgi:hypothetical protein
VEHLRHHRTENAYLLAPYTQLEGCSIPRSKIARTIDRLVDLGLIEITHQGGRAGGARQNPSLYRLTFVNHVLHSARIEYLPAGNDWLEVEQEMLAGRRQRPKRHARPPLKRGFNGARSATNLVVINAPIEEVQPRPEIARLTRRNRAHSNGLDRSGGPV